VLLAGRRSVSRRRVASNPNVTALSLPGDGDNPVSTPSPAGFPTGGIDFRFKGSIEESNPTSRVFVHKADELFRVSVTWNHVLRLQWRNAAGFQQVNATVAHGITLGSVASLRVVLRSDGGSGSIIEFYKSSDWDQYTDSGTWSLIGTAVTSTQSPVFHSSGGGALHLGGRADTTTENLDSEVRYLSLRPYGGSEFVRFDPTTVTSTDVRAPATCGDSFGNVWTLGGSTWSWVTDGSTPDPGGGGDPEPPAFGDVIANGDFGSDDANWIGFWYSGKSVEGGKAVFTNAPAYDGVQQNVSLVEGKYYQLTWTISSYVSGNVYPYLVGGAGRNGVARSSNGTFSERLLVNAGNNAFGFMMETGGTLAVDDVSLVGPYETATVGGS
jgi:hypothetical protein